jgi:hypothetical protein
MKTSGFVAALLILGGCATHQSVPLPPKAEPPVLSQAEIEARMKKAMTPGEQHKMLQGLEGNWNAKVSFWMSPGAKPEVSAAHASNQLILGGRYLQEHYRGTWDGKRFQGQGVWGFDNVAGKFQSSWIDSMSTQQMLSSGTYDSATKTITLTGTGTCPISGQTKNLKSVVTLIDKNHHRFEMYDVSPDGKDFKTLEISYTRAGRSHAKKVANKPVTAAPTPAAPVETPKPS